MYLLGVSDVFKGNVDRVEHGRQSKERVASGSKLTNDIENQEKVKD